MYPECYNCPFGQQFMRYPFPTPPPPPGGMHGGPQGGPPGMPPSGGMHGGPQGGPPTSPPPSFTPPQSQAQFQHQAGAFAIDPGAIRPCRNRFVYIWLRNGRSFWAWITFVGPRSIAGFRWNGRRWVYFGIDTRSIASFSCF